MTENATPIETLLERAENYTNSTIELFKLNAIDRSADVVSSLISRLTILIAIALSVLIISIGVALLVGNLLGNYFYGFFIVGGFYALMAILLNVFRHPWIKIPVSNSLIKQMLKQKNV
jgi:hypothetical protein